MTGPPSGRLPSLLDHLESAATGSSTIHLVREDAEIRMGDLWRDAHRCAAWISSEWPGEIAHAGVLEPTRACLVAVLGTWLAGRTFASLPERSRGMAVDEYLGQVATLARLAQASTVAVPEIHGARKRVAPGVEAVTYEGYGRRPASSGSEGGRLVQFTSGSTGMPRGVVLSMHDVGASARSMSEAIGLREGDVFVSWLPLSHDMGLIGMCLSPMAAFSKELGGAGSIWLSDPQRFVRDTLSWPRLASEVRATVTAAPNFALDLVSRRAHRCSTPLDLSSLRCIVVGSETVVASSLRQFEAALGPHGLRSGVLCPAYGLAEATLAVSIVRPGRGWSVAIASDRAAIDPEATTASDAELVSLGSPIPGMGLRIGADGGASGPIEICGAPVAKEFLGRPAERSDDGWLRTGDLGFLNGGELYFVGRRDDLLVIRGRNVDARDVQRVVSELDGVRSGSCAVFSLEATGFAVAFEVAGTPDLAELRRRCRSVSDLVVQRIGATPDRVLIVERGAVPRTPSGKAQPQRLRSQLIDGSVEPLFELPGAGGTSNRGSAA